MTTVLACAALAPAAASAQSTEAWRYLDYEMESGSAIKNIDFNGPAIGVGFRW